MTSRSLFNQSFFALNTLYATDCNVFQQYDYKDVYRSIDGNYTFKKMSMT